MQICVMVYVSSTKLKRLVGAALLLTFVLSLALALSGYIFPYSGGEPPRPKRMFMVVGTASFAEVAFLNRQDVYYQ